MNIEGRLYHYGLRAGIPYSALNKLANGVDAARYAPELARRKRLAREILIGSPYAGFIPEEKGYRGVAADTLPGTEKVLKTVRKIIRDMRAAGWKKTGHNPVGHLHGPEHFRDHPELLEFALSDVMLQIVSSYYGLVPQLKEVGIWVTGPQKDIYNSLQFHLDKPESKILGLFLNVETNSPENGPTTILPADVSRRIRDALNYERRYFTGSGFVSDEDVFKYCRPEDQISLGGKPGTGAFADTSNCFHFGSRCVKGERVMMMVKFMLPHKARQSRTKLFDLVPEPRDEIRRLALSGAVHSA